MSEDKDMESRLEIATMTLEEAASKLKELTEKMQEALKIARGEMETGKRKKQ